MREASRFAVEGFEKLAAGLGEEARERFEAGLRADAEDSACLLGVMRVHAVAGDGRGAARYAERLLAVDPSHGEAKSHLALQQLEEGDETALESLRALAGTAQAGLFERVNHARALSRLGRADAAEVAFDEAIRAEPHSPLPYLEAAEEALARGEPERAVARLREATRLAPNQPGLWVALAEAHEATGELGKAEDALISASGLAPEDTSLLERRYDLAYEAGRFEDAVGIAERLLEKVPRDPEYRFMRGQALAQVGRREEARRELQAVALANPDSPEPLQALAELASQEGDVAQAIRLLERALKRTPEDLGAANDLANLYLELDEPENVVKVLTPILEVHPGEPVSSFNMAMALAQTDPRAAAEHARAVVDSGHPQLAPEAEKLLAGLLAK